MKKILLLLVLLAPAMPSLVMGIQSQSAFNQERRDRLMGERFIKWCGNNGYDCFAMSENESETLWLDVWAHTEDYQNAVDSIESLMSVKNMILNNP